MNANDISAIFQWWIFLFGIGLIFFPLTTIIFPKFFDKGYIFSKVIGLLLISYSVWLLGSLRIFPFTESTISIIIFIFLVINIFLFVKVTPLQRLHLIKPSWKIWLFEELIFLTALLFWSYIRAYEPSIHGLEKYMDFGFVNSILRSEYFPPRDLWFTPLPINYYYFGHLVTAMLTKLSGIDAVITYNLMIATLFALTFSGAFSIGANLINQFKIQKLKIKITTQNLKVIAGGLLTSFLVTFAGNLHTIYAFFKPYILADNPVPFWQLEPSLGFFSYWYPNATRFIPFTIHEFPLYSFVVSDLHGHVLDLPFVLLTIALLFNILISRSLNLPRIFLLSLLIAVMYMTNAWDGIIYAGLTALVFLYLAYRSKNYTLYAIRYALMVVGGILLTLPFSLNFKPFVSGIGIICTPKFLTNIGQFGPFLFEPNHCQRSPFWQLAILYGFFYFFVILFIILNFGHWKLFRNWKLEIRNLSPSDIFVLILIFLSTLLIIIPEFLYVKDIYPAHYRANTMFKLTYQAFIMLSLVAGYTIMQLMLTIKDQKSKIFNFKYVFLIFAFLFFILVAIYPFFAINSYYGGLKTYQGIAGLSYLKNLYLQDYEAILWLKRNIKGQLVILEAQGDSYTDFARVSANTGLPTIIGWPVHEWLWRGSYNISAPRIADVQTLYETGDINIAKHLIDKYNISLIFVGDLEHQKYQISPEKFNKLGGIIFQNGQTQIYKVGL